MALCSTQPAVQKRECVRRLRAFYACLAQRRVFRLHDTSDAKELTIQILPAATVKTLRACIDKVNLDEWFLQFGFASTLTNMEAKQEGSLPQRSKRLVELARNRLRDYSQLKPVGREKPLVRGGYSYD
eukprot:1071061-Amphidinium_carterae.2